MSFDEKILVYISEHPLLGLIFIALFLGFLITLLVELIKWFVYGGKAFEELTEDQKATKDKTDNIIFRSLTLMIAGVCAYLVLMALGGHIKSLSLKIIFILLNTSFPFVIYHLKGKKIVEIAIGGVFTFFKKTVDRLLKK